MPSDRRLRWIATLAGCLAAGCSTPPSGSATAAGPDAPRPAPAAADDASTVPPRAPREFRGAWVATVNNIDWPSKRGLGVSEQKSEIVSICDRAAELKLNCLIVQVRPTADALYQSSIEPWSYFLTGTPGVAPSPAYDPLQTWIDEAHRRGIELHAWFNPYRVTYRAGQPLAPTSIARTHPEIVKQYADKLWLDPGEPLAAKQAMAVFNDVVRRYDVDGIHIDDYFYPYPELDSKKQEIPFPDDASWNRYKRTHPVKPNPATKPADVDAVARAEWRRQNVNTLVEELYRTTKQIKPWVKFGISPFGIGRAGKAPGIRGFDQYDKLYADAALWLRSGWCDYLSPQLYWPIAPPQQSFPVLFDYWHSENAKGRHVWPGLFTGLVIERKKGYTPTEIVNQIKVTRRDPDAGHVHFSFKHLVGDREQLAPTLESQVYQNDALVPASPWLDDKAPPAPTATRSAGGALTITPGRGEPAWQFAIWRRVDGRWRFEAVPASRGNVTLEPTATDVYVSSVDRSGNESPRVAAR